MNGLTFCVYLIAVPVFVVAQLPEPARNAMMAFIGFCSAYADF